ncbi:hypothetical protein B9T11_10095 [Wohlfahrtiimonas chitiniclastica]|uniref:hypothetical protein n=1 Tax=Wohlfahrtiimonas chitiniclastica TaxID=400946 RepID=UPI000B993F6B|nr:hypothetical protein [Wohlfahrtiimonas chitiniclastica]OYQ77500.1 hypothetical protein B9T11_10095 [Wohlfahrtiimonas chitiniclastica]
MNKSITIDKEYRKENILDGFAYIAKFNNMKKGAPANLLIEDPTLLFANSTIAGFKNTVISKSLTENPIYIVQECIRTNNLKIYSKPNEKLEYMSIFSQLGLLGNEKSLSHIIKFIKSFFFEYLQVPISNFKIRTFNDIEWNNSIENEFSTDAIELNSREKSYYQWSYGVDSLSGIGVTIAIYNDKLQKFQDIGNIIQLIFNGETVGFEFGFGLETLLARLNSFESPFEFIIKEMTNDYLHVPTNRKLLDSLMLSMYLLHLGVCEGRGKRSSVLKGSLNNLMYQCILNEVSYKSLLELSISYSSLRPLLSSSDKILEQDLHDSYDKVKKKYNLLLDYINYSRRHQKSHDLILKYGINKLAFPTWFITEVISRSHNDYQLV